MLTVLCGISLLLFIDPFAILASTTDETKNQTTEKSVNTVPIEFPKNESQYPFVHNETILKVLASHTSNDTEVDDLLYGGLVTHSLFNKTQAVTETTISENDSSTFTNRKWESELIENNYKTEEAKFNKSPSDLSPNSNNLESGISEYQGQLAIILAILLVLIALLGYCVLLSWRRFLEKRYGTREMLVNEEDFYDPNDMNHFSI